jgi:hypothetical protein
VREAVKFAKRSRPTFVSSKDKMKVYMLPEGATTVHITEVGHIFWEGVKGEAVEIDY